MRRMLRGVVRLMAACVTAALGLPASAHTLLLSRAEATVREDHVDVEIDVSCEDFVHWYDLAVNDDGLAARHHVGVCARRHEALLKDVFVIRDADGNRLRGGGFVCNSEWLSEDHGDRVDPRTLQARYVASFELPGRSPLLAFQLLPRAASMTMPWQIALRVNGAPDEQGVMTPVTSKGNIEVVEVAWKADHAAISAPPDSDAKTCRSCEERGSDRFKEICADIVIGDRGVDAAIHIPLPLLFTFREFRQPEGDFLSAADRGSTIDAAKTLMQSALRIDAGDEALSAQLVSAKVHNAMDGEADVLANDAPVSVWLGRLDAQVRFDADSPIQRAALRWSLFNSGVVVASASIRSGDLCTEHEFSTYAPDYKWKPTGPLDGRDSTNSGPSPGP